MKIINGGTGACSRARLLHEKALMDIPFKLQLKNVVKFVFFLFTGHYVNCVMAVGFMVSGFKAT